jgi:hypothetical protein
MLVVGDPIRASEDDDLVRGRLGAVGFVAAIEHVGDAQRSARCMPRSEARLQTSHFQSEAPSANHADHVFVRSPTSAAIALGFVDDSGTDLTGGREVDLAPVPPARVIFAEELRALLVVLVESDRLLTEPVSDHAEHGRDQLLG